MDFSPLLNFPYLLPNQAQKHVTVNESLRRLDAIVQISVKTQTLAIPPGSPAEGDRYIIAASATAEWLGHEKAIAAYQDSAWEIIAPNTGWTAWLEDEGKLIVFDGADWTDVASGGAGPTDLLGVNATADTTNRFALSSPASLFNHEGDDHRVVVNKASDVDTASLLFQSNFGGHAELGLMGEDAFSVKVSPDGASFKTGFMIDPTSAYVGIATNTPTTALHVEGILRLQSFDIVDLPSASSVGRGAIAMVNDFLGSPNLAVSNGSHWYSVRNSAFIV